MSELAQLTQLIERTDHALQLHAARKVDSSLVVRNWLIGWYIVDALGKGQTVSGFSQGGSQELPQDFSDVFRQLANCFPLLHRFLNLNFHARN